MSLRIEPLTAAHRPLLADFQTSHASLSEYLGRYALRHATKDLIARTYLAIQDTRTGPRLAGYFSLAAASVQRSSLASVPTLSRLPGYPIPAVLLARLAVDTRVQGQGLGRYLLESALGMAIELALSGPLGFRLFVTDAIDDAAAAFYRHFGFTPLGDGLPRRMVLDLAPLVRAR